MFLFLIGLNLAVYALALNFQIKLRFYLHLKDFLLDSSNIKKEKHRVFTLYMSAYKTLSVCLNFAVPMKRRYRRL